MPLAFNPFANFRNLIDGGDFSINPLQRNIPGLASGGVIATPVAATPTYFADRFFAAGCAASAILMAAVADAAIAASARPQGFAPGGNANTGGGQLGQASRPSICCAARARRHALVLGAKPAPPIGRRPQRASDRRQRRQPERGEPHRRNVDVRVFGGQRPAGADLGHDALSVTGVVPARAAQLAILLSFTPSGTAGADDSISINGVQLEIGAFASPFEHIDAQVALEICQRYAWAIPEPAAGVVIGAGANTGASAQLFYIATPCSS